jgi:hypothetical protein
VDGVDKGSLATAGANNTLCSTTGARYEGKHFGTHPASVLIPQ